MKSILYRQVRFIKYPFRTFNAVLFLLLASVTAGPSFAEIYKYQDEQGRWHFTDIPGRGATVTDVDTSEREAATKSRDLSSDLLNKYKPGSPVEHASLAVISIQSTITEGSGFFISESGHIITNKHVVRPRGTEQWKELEDRLSSAEIKYNKARREYRNEQERLREAEQSLVQRKKRLDRIDEGYQKVLAESEYKMLRKHFEHSKKGLKYFKDNHDDSKREYESARREFNMLSSLSSLAKSFKIRAKDGTRLTARLLAVSEENDLALLKTDDHKTPYIRPGSPASLRHGMRVFAIGSPLGIKDVITSGIVAGLKDNFVIIDATVLPGSSGGPLLTEDGKVVGVNSIRVSQVAGGEGLGVAISIDTALSDFRKFLE